MTAFDVLLLFSIDRIVDADAVEDEDDDDDDDGPYDFPCGPICDDVNFGAPIIE